MNSDLPRRQKKGGKTMPINNAGNTEDVRNSIKCGFDKLKLKDFEAAIENEKQNQNRATVIRLLESAIRKKLDKARRSVFKQL